MTNAVLSFPFAYPYILLLRFNLSLKSNYEHCQGIHFAHTITLEREREKERQTDRQTETETETQKETQKETQRETEIQEG